MTTYDDLAQAAAALADPTISSRELMSIAQAYPSLWADVAGHPNAYPDLLSWLQTVGDDTVREAIAAREPSPEIPSPPPPPPADEQPADESPKDTGTEASDTEADAQSTPLESDNPIALEASTPVEESIDFQTPDSPQDSPTTLEDTVPSASETQTPPVEASPRKPSWISTPKGKKILIGSGSGLLAVILAVVLIVNLVVIPHQRAEEAAAAEQARLEQEHQAAVDAFTKAVDSCTQANKSLTDSITHAQQTATTDPSTLDDPSLIDALNQAITTAQSVKTCVPPTMADDTATIQEQTTQVTTDTATVTTSISTLTTADQSVTTSVQTKKDKEAAAQAAEEAKQKADQEAAYQAAHTLTSSTTTSDGYSYTTTVTLTDWYKVTDTTRTTSAWNSVGGVGSWTFPADSSGFIPGGSAGNYGIFEMDKSAVLFGKMTVANTTPAGFSMPSGKANPSITLSNRNSQVYCFQFSSSLKCGMFGGNPNGWNMDAGKSQTVSFFLLDGLAFTPTDPTGQGVISQVLQLSPDAKTSVPGTW